MPSFQTTVTPSRRSAARYVNFVRRSLQKALAEEKARSGVTQSAIARAIGVHRSVINREVQGKKDLTLGRVAELAWAMGYEPQFKLVRSVPTQSTNAPDPMAALDISVPAQQLSPTISFQSASVPR